MTATTQGILDWRGHPFYTVQIDGMIETARERLQRKDHSSKGRSQLTRTTIKVSRLGMIAARGLAVESLPTAWQTQCIGRQARPVQWVVYREMAAKKVFYPMQPSIFHTII
jgi:hypothetical protein